MKTRREKLTQKEIELIARGFSFICSACVAEKTPMPEKAEILLDEITNILSKLARII